MNPIMRHILLSGKADITQKQLKALKARLSGGLPATILVQGDSTGNDANEWFYLAMEWLASKYPTHSFLYRRWDDTGQSYSNFFDPYVMQIGSSGHGYATLPGIANGRVTAPDSDALNITTDLEIIAKVTADDWSAGGNHAIINKLGGSGDRGWYFGYAYSTLCLWWSADGVNLVGPEYGTDTPPWVNGQAMWFKATLDADNGAGGYDLKFYYSTDGISFTQLGTTITGAATTSIFNNSADLELGCRDNGDNFFVGKIHTAFVKNGIGGSVVASFEASQLVDGSMKDAEGNTWTLGSASSRGGSPGVLLLNASTPGEAIAYSLDTARFAKQAAIEPHLAFVNYSHNDQDVTDYKDTYAGLIAKIRVAYSGAGIIACTQNPEKSPATYITQHAIRQSEIKLAAAAQNVGVIDAYAAFMATDYSSLINEDGYHPTIEGSLFWENVVTAALEKTL